MEFISLRNIFHKPRTFTLSCTAPSPSPLFMSSDPNYFTTVRLHVVLARPFLPSSWGFLYKSFLTILSYHFLVKWPLHFHFLSLSGLLLVRSHRCWFVTILDQHMLKYLRNLLAKVCEALFISLD